MITKEEVIKGTKQELVEFLINTVHINPESTDETGLTSKKGIENQVGSISTKGGIGKVFHFTKKESDSTNEVNLVLNSTIVEVIS